MGWCFIVLLSAAGAAALFLAVPPAVMLCRNRYWRIRTDTASRLALSSRSAVRALSQFAARGLIPPAACVLDVGCGDGAVLAAIPGAQERWGVDIDAEAIRIAKERFGDALRLTVAPAGALPFTDGRFDAVYCISLLHCLEDPATALREAARVLAPGGVLIVAEPTYPPLFRQYHDLLLRRLRGAGDRRHYSRGEVLGLLAPTGLAVGILHRGVFINVVRGIKGR